MGVGPGSLEAVVLTRPDPAFWAEKRVLLTGHTGFKGGWLTLWLRSLGADVRDVSLPHTSLAIPVYYVLAPAEASSNLARYDGVRYGRRGNADGLREMYERTRSGGFGAEVTRRILLGTYVLSAGYYDAYYRRAQTVRALITQDFERVFAEHRLVLNLLPNFENINLSFSPY